MDNKDRISNILAVLFLLIFISSIVGIIYLDLKDIEKNLTDCRKKCYPQEIVESLSKYNCMCKNEIEILYSE